VALRTAVAVVELFKETEDAIWTEYDLATSPFLIYVPETWALLVNAPHTPEGFTACPPGWPELGMNALYHEGRYDDLVGQLEFDFELDGVRTVALPTWREIPRDFPNPNLYYFTFVVHEAFHQHQRESFTLTDSRSEERYPVLDIDNTALAVLEMRLLMDALQAVGADDRVQAEEREYELHKELVEGTAKYVEAKGVELLRQHCHGGTASAAFAQTCEELGGTTMEEYLLRDFEGRLQGQTLSPETVARHRIYPVGSTMGILLDYLGVDWKRRAAEDGEDFSFVGLLDEQFEVRPVSMSEQLAWAKRRYGFEAIAEATRREVEQYLASYEAALEEFEATPGYRIEVRVSSNGVSRSRSSRSRRWVVGDGTRVFSRHYVTYTLRLPSDGFFLQVQDAALLDVTDWDIRTKSVVFFSPDPPAIALDGGAMAPISDGTYDFERVAASGDGLEVRSESSGTLTVDGRQVTIDLVNRSR
jgi:hypothetical protein